ncbi:MAG TPA: dihydrolipoyl dehydrogenase, partial [Polyangia bacterium]|nr:dihydrolipoyl dehydrogenase [Polyangia bacterium]
MADKYDLVVVGAGPGGYVAAIRGAQLGFKTACIERERPGGICLNWGCIPTKALLKSAEAMRAVQHAGEMGIVVNGTVSFDWTKIIARSRAVSEKLAGGVEFLFKKYGVTHIPGTATLTGRNKLEVTTKSGKLNLETPRTIIATGARAKFLPGIEPDGDRVITYREAMVLPEVPKSVVVIGAGAIGIEFADFWNAFGVEVTVIEFMPRILPIEDEEVSASLTRILKKKGMTIHTGAKTTGVKVSGKTVTTSFTTADGQNQTVTSERVLMAVGVRANVEGIGLEGMGVTVDRGFIQVDDQYRTTSPGIWSIGDCAGPPLLAHVAMAEGVRTVEWMAGHHTVPVNYDAIPGCTYCDPEVASIGK